MAYSLPAAGLAGINPLVLQKSKLFMKVSIKAASIPYPELRLLINSSTLVSLNRVLN